MREAAPLAVPDSLIGELRTLVQLYRGEPVFSGGGISSGTETAVVLGAQVLSGGRPSGTLRGRVLHAARLYAEGKIGLIIPTGGVGKHPPSEAEVAVRILRKARVPEEAILPEREARNTRESARLVGAMAREREIRSLLVITDPLHCVRVVEAFRAEGLLVWPSPAYGSPMWRKRGLRRGQFLREIGALIWYRIRGAKQKAAWSRFLP